MARRGVLLTECGGRREMPRSAFKGRTVRDAFCLRQNATVVGCLTRRGVLLGRCGGRWELLRSAFLGTCRPRRILPSAKCYEVSAGLARRGVLLGRCGADGGRCHADGRRCHVQRLRGRTVRDAFLPAAKCYEVSAGLARRGVLLSRCGGRWEVLRSAFKGRTVRDAFCLAAKCYGVPVVWRGGVFCGLCAVFVAKQKLHAGGRRILSGR